MAKQRSREAPQPKAKFDQKEPVRYRVKNLGTWNEGTIENLSQSGVLVGGQQRFPENTLIEMVFEMPEAISGQKNSKVLCQGRITRMIGRLCGTVNPAKNWSFVALPSRTGCSPGG